jgi:hypothetical protein
MAAPLYRYMYVYTRTCTSAGVAGDGVEAKFDSLIASLELFARGLIVWMYLDG